MAPRPDLLLQRAERRHARLPLDAKYKRYDNANVDVDDLTQVFVYAYAYRDPEASGPPRAVLVYPSETPGKPRVTRLEVRSVAERIVDAELTVAGLHIPSVLDAVHAGSGCGLEALRELALGALPPTGVTVSKLHVSIG